VDASTQQVREFRRGRRLPAALLASEEIELSLNPAC